MENSKSSSGTIWVVLLLLAAVIGAGVLTFGIFKGRGQMPTPPISDIREGTREAAKVERVQGLCERRPQGVEDAEPLEAGSALQLGNVIRCDAKAAVTMMTTGNWLVSVEDDAEAVMQDARRTEDHGLRTLSFKVGKGTFRAKPGAADPKGNFLEVETAAGKLIVREGEIGLKVGPDGKGQAWLMSGSATMTWTDGRTKELGLKGLESL